jgi:hypothetical protein
MPEMQVVRYMGYVRGLNYSTTSSHNAAATTSCVLLAIFLTRNPEARPKCIF